MKTLIEFIRKYFFVIMAIAVCFLSLLQISCGNQPKPQQLNIDSIDNQKSKSDSLYTAKANILLQQKDSFIEVLHAKLANEKTNTAAQRAKANEQHVLNDSLQAKYSRELSLLSCDELIQGLKVEITDKDSVIESLEVEIDNYACEVIQLEEKVIIQKGIIDSKQNLIESKDSTINHLATLKRKSDFWNKAKIKAAGAVILFESIKLLIK